MKSLYESFLFSLITIVATSSLCVLTMNAQEGGPSNGRRRRKMEPSAAILALGGEAERVEGTRIFNSVLLQLVHHLVSPDAVDRLNVFLKAEGTTSYSGVDGGIEGAGRALGEEISRVLEGKFEAVNSIAALRGEVGTRATTVQVDALAARLDTLEREKIAMSRKFDSFKAKTMWSSVTVVVVCGVVAVRKFKQRLLKSQTVRASDTQTDEHSNNDMN